MSRTGRSLLLLLQRCVAVRPVTFPTGFNTRCSSSSVFSGRCGFIQPPTWTSTSRAICQLQSAVRSSQHRFCTKAGDSCEDEYPPLPAYHLDPEPETKEVYIMRVKGLPWSCSAQDLLQFFSDCRIRDGVKGIHLTEDMLGRPSGQAFIEMEHEEDVSKALEKHRQYLGPRYVEVYEVTDSDAEAILKETVQAPADSRVVRLRGLPFSCTEVDIIQFFSGLDIVENGITIVTDDKGRNSGQAFVQFSSQEAAAEALQRDREVIGNRYIEVFPSRSDQIYSSWSDRMRSASPHASPQAADRTTPASQTKTAGFGERTVEQNRTNSEAEAILKETVQAPADSGVVRLRGLPFSSTEVDIIQFFSGLDIVENGITIVTDYKGRNSGQAFVQFSSQEAADEALQRDGEFIGNRYIKLFPSRSDQIYSSWSDRTGRGEPHAGPQAADRTAPASQTKTASPQKSGLPLHYIHMRGLPYQASGEDIVEFFSPLVVSKILLECSRDGKLNGEADVYFSCHQDALTAMSKDREHIGGRYIELFLNSDSNSDGRR